MLKKLDAPTFHSKEYISKYLNKNIELQGLPNSAKKHTPYFPNIPCKFYMRNACFKGDECIFSHDEAVIANHSEKDKENIKEKIEEEETLFVSPFE